MNILFLCVDQVEICIDRIALRVAEGGHNVNPDIVRSRYNTGLKLLSYYKNFPDRLVLLDNSSGSLITQAELIKGQVHFKKDKIFQWVKELLDGNQPHEQKPFTSIDDVRKHYKKKE